MNHQCSPNSGQGHFVQQVERAVLDLRRGVPVVIRDGRAMCLSAPVDGVTAARFDDMRAGAGGPVRLILNDHRLAHLGVDDPPKTAAIALRPADTLVDAIRWAADPAATWPADRPVLPAAELESAALALARRGLLIPAALCIIPDTAAVPSIEARLSGADLLAVSVADVWSHCRAAPSLERVTEAHVPLAAAPDSRFVVFREAGVLREHVAILIGDRAHWPVPVPVRAHSACLTGDLFGSVRCDCGSQLRRSVSLIGKRGGGVLLYLAQEGRGTGLTNKIRAYQIQDEGLDTVDADRVLGFGGDERDYAVAREMLAQLGIARIDLLTNNPTKLAGMNREPIRVVSRSCIYGQLTGENRRYLATKATRAGHWLDALLSHPFDADAVAQEPERDPSQL